MNQLFWTPYRITLVILSLLFCAATAAWLSNVPGLLGDEASEGENVYQILHGTGLTVEGERSYIGPLIDYARIPFILLFGYTPLALRLLVLGASWLLFALLVIILRDSLGNEESLLPLVFLVFSPIYLVYQRLGWAITLNVFFVVLLIFVLLKLRQHRPLLAGLIGGLGLHNHIIFLGSLVGIAVVGFALGLRKPRQLLMWWPTVIGFLAGFGTQAAVLLLYPSDQGNVGQVAQSLGQRWHDLPSLLPLVLSGSSFSAAYTGVELTPTIIVIITSILALLVIVALVFSRQRRIAWLVAAGLMIQLAVLMYMIDRFSLRYFVVTVLGVWFLAGMGADTFIGLLRRRFMGVAHWAAGMIAVSLLLFTITTTLLPFLRTGGSANMFSLGNRTDSAAALMDTRDLVRCVRGFGPLYSDNVHVYNRLVYLSHQYTDITVLDEDHKQAAQYLVDYRLPDKAKQSAPGDVCPELTHFRIITKQKF